MRTILTTASVALGIAAAAAAPHGQVRPGEPTKGEVWVMNRDGEAIPVLVRQTPSDPPLRVRVAAPRWDYQTVVIKTGVDPARALAAAGAEGWETTGLSFPASDGTTVLLKKPR